MKSNEISENTQSLDELAMTLTHSNRCTKCPNTRKSIGNEFQKKKYIEAQRIQDPVSALVQKQKKTDNFSCGYKVVVCRAYWTVFGSVGCFFHRQVAENHSGAIIFW